MKLISNLLHPPKTFRFNEYDMVNGFNIPQEVYDNILSIVDVSVSKPRCSQGVVIVDKIKGQSKKNLYQAKYIIPFPYTYAKLFS
ncbi:MAG: hypothetical protein GQ477_02370 [Nanohaloarchaea archaeon]|nr:hypothetical protein [Candidatus Nanohaloarchaea archaeon]